jgi:hypothetical protein
MLVNFFGLILIVIGAYTLTNIVSKIVIGLINKYTNSNINVKLDIFTHFLLFVWNLLIAIIIVSYGI